MWARRIGAPAGCPSRVKVIFFSFFSGTLGLSIYMYMAGSNVSYLDLEASTSQSVLCLVDWPLRKHAISWSVPEEWLTTFFDPGGPDAWFRARQSRCSTETLSTTQCAKIVIPVNQMKRPLALPMGVDLDQADTFDVLGIWARFFLLLTAAIWCGVTIHDLALIGRRKKHFILDVSGINEHCPSIRTVWRALAGYRVLTRLVTQESLGFRIVGIGLAVIIGPVAVAWNLLLFNFFIVPLLLLAFVRYPIRMSRAWVFIACLACSIYGVGLTLQQLAFVVERDLRPRYAVTWRPDELLQPIPINVSNGYDNSTIPGNGNADELQAIECTCGCDYPVSFSVCVNLLIVGLLTTLKSAFLAFRCLKGLRRSQWANLLSVMFPIPITMYEVDWRQPNGMPIRHRTTEVPVQGEIAFDPFALMDEQMDSALTTIHLKPERVHRYERNSISGELKLISPGRNLEIPSAPVAFCASDLKVRKVEYIGCCGFPWPTGGTQCVYEPQFVAQLEGADTDHECATTDGDSPSNHRDEANPTSPIKENSTDDSDMPQSPSSQVYGRFAI